MFDLPKSTEIKKPIHKKLIYHNFAAELNGDRRDKFDADVSRIFIINEISEASVNIRATEKVSSIFVVQLELKTKEYNERNIILVSRLFKQNLLLALHYEDEYQLAIYETRLLRSAWKAEGDFGLKLQGLDLESVWESLVTQVSGIEAAAGLTLDEQISIEAEKEKLRKQIEDLERRARRETQAKKKFELFQQIKEIERQRNRLFGKQY